MPQRFVYNPRTGELSGVTTLKIGNPQVSIQEYVTNYVENNKNRVYDSDLVVATLEKNFNTAGSGSAGFDSDQIVAILNENNATGGFDSDQIVAIINENVRDFQDSDLSTVSILRNDLESDTNYYKLRFIEVQSLIDSESNKVDTVKRRLIDVEDNDSDKTKQIQALFQRTDSDGGSLAGVKRFIRGENPSPNNIFEYYSASGQYGSNPFHDSDLVIASAQKGFNVAAASYDSDRVVQTIITAGEIALKDYFVDSDEVFNMGTEHGWFFDSDKVMQSVSKNINSTITISGALNNLLDSEEVTRMFVEHEIATQGDIDSEIALIKTALDSETSRIQLLLSNADSDQIEIARLRVDADSDTQIIQSLKTQAELDSARITLIRNDLDSDTTAIQAIRTDMDSESARVNSRLSSLDGSINSIDAVQIVQNSRLVALESRADSDELKIQSIQEAVNQLRLEQDSDSANSGGSGSGVGVGITDSDLKVVADLRNDLDSDFTAFNTRITSNFNDIQTLNSTTNSQGGRITLLELSRDSESAKVQTLQGSVDTNTATLNAYGGRISILETNADSDEIAIQTISTAVGVLQARADSDETVIQDLSTRIETLEVLDSVLANVDSDLKVVGDLRNDLDSDFTAFNTRLAVAELDIDNSQSDIVTIQSRLDTAEARLDSDEIAIQSLSSNVSTIESRLDSDETAIQANLTSLTARLDSDETALQTLDTTINTLTTKVDSIETSLDSETARIQLLLLSTDSDALDISGLKLSADSDAAAIAELLRQADSDAAAISALRTEFSTDITTLTSRADSDELKLQSHSARLDSDEIAISARLPLAGGTMSGDIDGNGNKVLFANVYANEGDLPNATTYHGMFAHVHATGAGYFAHAGNWVKLANNSDLGLSDSDLKVVADLRNDLDSESSEIRTMRSDLDSDSIKIQLMAGQISALEAGTYDDTQLVARLDSDTSAISQLRADVDSDSIVIQSLDGRVSTLENAVDDTGFDSDQIVAIINENVVPSTGMTDSDLQVVADLRNDVDSDSIRIQDLQTQIDNIDVADLRARLDSDSIAIQSIRTAVDSDYALFNAKIALFNGLTDSDLTTVAKLRSDVDSDSTKLQALEETVGNLNSLSREDSDIINQITGARLVDTVQVIGGSQTDVDSFLANDIRAAKYIVVVSSDSDSTYQTDELLVIHDGSSAYVTQYGQINTADSELATFDASYTAGSVYLKATGTRNNIRFDAQRLQVNVANNSIIIGGTGSLVVDSDDVGTFAASFSNETRFNTAISRDPSNGGTNADLMTTRLATALQDKCDNFPANSGNLEYGHFVFYNNGSPVYDFCAGGIPSIFNNRLNPGDITVTSSNNSTQSTFRVSFPTNLVFSPQFEGTTYNPGQWSAANNGNTEFDEFRLYLNSNTTGVTEANSTLAFSATVAALTAP